MRKHINNQSPACIYMFSSCGRTYSFVRVDDVIFFSFRFNLHSRAHLFTILFFLFIGCFLFHFIRTHTTHRAMTFHEIYLLLFSIVIMIVLRFLLCVNTVFFFSLLPLFLVLSLFCFGPCSRYLLFSSVYAVFNAHTECFG